MYKAVVLGGTGAVGSNIVKELVNSPKCQLVTLLGRRKLELAGITNSTKIEQFTINMDKIEEETAAILNGHEVAFNALGVGRPSTVSHEELKKIDVDYATSFARACKSRGVKHISLLGAISANKNSMMFYLQMKGEVEENYTNLNFDRVSFYRPSLLVTPEARFGVMDSFNQFIVPKVTWMLPSQYHEIKVEKLAKAMRINAENPPKSKVEIYHYEDYVELLKLENDTP